MKKIDWTYPRVWKTFAGKTVHLNKIDHQHLSNTYWFCKLHQNASDESLELFKNEAKERFNGQLLPYRPHINFKEEINELYHMGCLKWINDKKRIIRFENQEIGEVIYF